jgi:hypothetical protein
VPPAAAGEKPPPDGCGVVLYQTEDGHLAMAGLPAAQGVVQVGGARCAALYSRSPAAHANGGAAGR